jgi:hypothetical protein
VLTNPVRCCLALLRAYAYSNLTPRFGFALLSLRSGVRWERHSTASPLMRAKLLLPSTAYIIQTSIPSAVPILTAFGYLYRLFVQSSAYTIYHHRTRARVINYWRVRAPTCSQCPSPDHPKRKNEENPSRTARARHPVTVML